MIEGKDQGWTYLKYDKDGDLTAGKLPPQGSILLVFEALRWRLMVGYLEPNTGQGCTSILDPHIDDHCTWLAWAPLDEPTNPEMIRLESCDGATVRRAVGYVSSATPPLIRSYAERIPT